MKKIYALAFFLYSFIGLYTKSNAQDSISIGFKAMVHSSILKEDRMLWIHLPPKLDKSKEYVVVYLLDAEINFNYFTTISSFLSRGSGNKIPEMIIVGIVNNNRTKDLTPTKASVKGENGKLLFEDSGGSEAFLSFIQQELKPFISKEYARNSQEIFIGHSFGGLTVTDCLLNHPEYFNYYVANDPSFWWDNGYIVKLAIKKWKEPIAILNNKRLFISHSGVTRDKSHFGADGPEINKEFNALLQQNTSLKYKDLTYKDETHGTISLPANIDALKFLYDL